MSKLAFLNSFLPKMKMSPLNQFLLLLGILVVALLLKNVWDYYMKKWNLHEGFESLDGFADKENTKVTLTKDTIFPYYNTDSKNIYVLSVDQSKVIMFDFDNGNLIKYQPNGSDDNTNFTADSNADFTANSTANFDVYTRQYGASVPNLTNLPKLGEKESISISRETMKNLYNTGYVQKFTDMTDLHVVMVPFGTNTIVHLFNGTNHLKTRYFSENGNFYPSVEPSDPADNYLPGYEGLQEEIIDTPAATYWQKDADNGEIVIFEEHFYHLIPDKSGRKSPDNTNDPHWIAKWKPDYTYKDSGISRVTHWDVYYTLKDDKNGKLVPHNQGDHKHWIPDEETADQKDSFTTMKDAIESFFPDTSKLKKENFETSSSSAVEGTITLPGYAKKVHRVDEDVYVDPTNGFLILYMESRTNSLIKAYDNSGEEIADPTDITKLPVTARTGFRGWAKNGLTDDYFVIYVDTSVKISVTKVKLDSSSGAWSLGKTLRLVEGKIVTSPEDETVDDESPTDTSNNNSDSSSSSSSSSSGKCAADHVEMQFSGLTMCVPTSQFFGAMFGGSNGSTGVNSNFIRKTEVVPPVCPQCPRCPSYDGVCGNCGGNGGSGTGNGTGGGNGKDNSIGGLTRGAGEGTASLARDAGSGASSLARDTVGGAAGMTTDAVKGTAGMATNAVKGTVGLGKEVAGGTIGLGKDVVGGTIGLGKDVAGGVGGVITGAAGAVGSGLGAVGSGIGNLVSGGGNGGQGSAGNQAVGGAGGVYGQGYYNSYGGPGRQQQTPGMDPYSYYGAVPPRASCNFIPRTADFSSFGK